MRRRVKIQAGVEGYVICSKQGQVLRRLPSMTQAQAELYADYMSQLSRKARGVVRDLNPKNELRRVELCRCFLVCAVRRRPSAAGTSGSARSATKCSSPSTRSSWS
jgi:dynein light chain roadblock-type